MRVTDAQTGVCPGMSDCVGGPHVQIAAEDSNQEQIYFDAFHRASGTANDGVYTKTVNVRQYSKKGTWAISQVRVTDSIGNDVSYFNEAELLAAVPTATGTTLTNVALVDDSTPPVIESFSITPTEFNTESGCIIDCYNASD
jgi:hypothetical protein